MLLVLAICSTLYLTEAHDWQPGTNGQAMWAFNCDFKGNDIASQESSGEAWWVKIAVGSAWQTSNAPILHTGTEFVTWKTQITRLLLIWTAEFVDE